MRSFAGRLQRKHVGWRMLQDKRVAGCGADRGLARQQPLQSHEREPSIGRGKPLGTMLTNLSDQPLVVGRGRSLSSLGSPRDLGSLRSGRSLGAGRGDAPTQSGDQGNTANQRSDGATRKRSHCVRPAG